MKIMKFKTVNPATEQIIGEYETMERQEVLKITDDSTRAFV